MEAEQLVTTTMIDLTQANEILRECLEATEGSGTFCFHQGSVMGKLRPRREAYLCQADKKHDYRYSRSHVLSGQGISAHIQHFVERYCIRFGEDCENGGVLVNEYPGEKKAREMYGTTSSVAAHSDNEHEIYMKSTIFSLSVGAPRIFRYRKKGKDVDGKNYSWQKILTTHGMLITMLPGFQEQYEHEVPKTKSGRSATQKQANPTTMNPLEYRYNITVRPACLACEAAGRAACSEGRKRKRESTSTKKSTRTKQPF